MEDQLKARIAELERELEKTAYAYQAVIGELKRMLAALEKKTSPNE